MSARLMQVAGQVLRFAALAGVTYLVLRWRWRGSSRRVFAVAILALTLLDLGAFGTKFISTQPAPPNSTWWPLADRVMAKEREQYRVLEYVVEHTIEPGTNDHILFHLQNLNGYDPLMLPDAIELTEVNYGLEEKLLDMLAVRYILLSETIKIDTSGLRQVAQQNGVIVYERPHPQARAFVVHRLQVASHAEVLAQLLDPAFDPRSAAIVEAPPGCALAESAGQDSVALTRDEMNRVVLETHAGSDGFLVMSDAFYPGWRAEVDGQPRPVVRANYALRGICLPAGDHRVVFSFEPATLRAGIWVSLLGLVAVIGSISGERLFRRPGC